MKFSCEQERLNSALSAVIRSVSPKSSIPALEGIFIMADKGLSFTGYNLETGTTAKIPAQIEEKGSLVIAAKLFADMIRKMPNEEITISTEGYWVTISGGSSQFKVMGTDPSDYPDIPDVTEHFGLVMEQGMLKNMIGATHFAISTNESRIIHTGSLFEVEGDRLNIVSVDGYRLALRSEEVDKVIGNMDFSFVVPGTALSEVEKICGHDDEISIFISDKHIMFRTDTLSLVTRRLEGEFLNYRTAIPVNNEYVVTCPRRELIYSIERVSLMISDKVKAPLRCLFKDDVVEMSSKTAIGEADDICSLEGNGGNLEMGFNHRYLLEALRHAPADKVRVEFTTAVAPCLILPEEEGDLSFQYMVLPVRLKGD